MSIPSQGEEQRKASKRGRPERRRNDADQTAVGDGGFERVPPQDLDAEQSVLGGMLLSKDAIADVVEAVKGIDFYRPAHETIFNAILDVYGRGEPADPITLAAELTKRGEIARVGGSAYLHTLVNVVPTAANAEYYADIVHERAILRRLVEAGTRIVQMGYAGQGDTDEIVAAASAEIADVVEGSVRQDDDYTTWPESLPGTLALMEDAGKSKGISGLATGFTDLDSVTQGLHPGQVIVVAGRPAMGKTTLGMDLVRHCTIAQNRPAMFISLEMGIDELNMRTISAEGRVALHHIRSGTMTSDDWDRTATAANRMMQAPLYINESAHTWLEIQAKIRRVKSRHPDLSLVVIDYLQLITLGRRTESRQQEVSEISRSIKLLAKELQIPIIALAQLNRGPEMRTEKKPVVSDLRESGSIEQDADIVILLHREDAYTKESPRSGEADLIIGKHRGGPTCTITVAAQLHYSRFVDMAENI